MPDLDLLPHIASQYRASLAMLGQAIDLCPEVLWLSADYQNRFWHVAYHAVFYTHFYLQTDEASFRPWAKHKPDSNFLGRRPWAPHEPPKIDSPYTKAEVLEYHELCRAEVDVKVPALDLSAPSGFLRSIRPSCSSTISVISSTTQANWRTVCARWQMWVWDGYGWRLISRQCAGLVFRPAVV